MKIITQLKSKFLEACRYAQHLATDEYVNRILSIADFSKISKKAPEKLENVIFVTPFMTLHSGGLTSTLRIAKKLSDAGVNVVLTCPSSDDCGTMMRNAKTNLESYDAKYIIWNEATHNEYDFVIAVEDIMVYYARKLKGYLIYFVQDYEPYFCPVGDRYFLSKKAYELGEDIISLGNWNIEEIKKNCKHNAELGTMYSIEFPFESQEYPYVQRQFAEYRDKKEINIAVYIKRESKRLPGIVMSMLAHTSQEFAKHGEHLHIYYFGLHKVEKPMVGTNLGRISKKEIQKLYAKCDFGLVASMTNISLVPYEMISSGLPVIEFKDGSYTSFLGEDTAILLNTFDYEELVNKIRFYINNPEELAEITYKATRKVSGLSWDNTGNQFYEILNSLLI